MPTPWAGYSKIYLLQIATPWFPSHSWMDSNLASRPHPCRVKVTDNHVCCQMQWSLLTFHLNHSAAFDPTGNPLRKFPLVFPAVLDSFASHFSQTTMTLERSQQDSFWALSFVYSLSQGDFIQLCSPKYHLYADFSIYISYPDLSLSSRLTGDCLSDSSTQAE